MKVTFPALLAVVTLSLTSIVNAQNPPSTGPPTPNGPYWASSDGPQDQCSTIKPTQTCLFGHMNANAFANGAAASANLDGSEGGPACSLGNQAQCAGSRSWNFTFHDPTGDYTPRASSSGLATGEGMVDAENVVCVGASNWVVTYGISEVKCTLWDLGETCVCNLECAKDSDSRWSYVGTIYVGGVPVPISVPMKTNDGPKNADCSVQGAGSDDVGMYTIIWQQSIMIEGVADGCLLDTAVVTGSSSLTNSSTYTNTWY